MTFFVPGSNLLEHILLAKFLRVFIFCLIDLSLKSWTCTKHLVENMFFNQYEAFLNRLNDLLTLHLVLEIFLENPLAVADAVYLKVDDRVNKLLCHLRKFW